MKLVDRAMRKEDSSAQGQIITEMLQHLHACNNSVRVNPTETIIEEKLSYSDELRGSNPKWNALGFDTRNLLEIYFDKFGQKYWNYKDE